MTKSEQEKFRRKKGRNAWMEKEKKVEGGN